MPVSSFDRMSRPIPCFNLRMANGNEYSLNPFSLLFGNRLIARHVEDLLGHERVTFVMMTQLSAGPLISIPSQKLSTPNKMLGK